MSELPIITKPFRADGSLSPTKSKASKLPETFYTENSTFVKTIKTNNSQGLSERSNSKSLKSFANSLLLPIKGFASQWKSSTIEEDEPLKLTESLAGMIGKSERKLKPTEKELIEKQVEEINILHEYKLLIENAPPGVYIVPSLRSLQVWHGILFVRSGIFEEGSFRFDLFIPDGFPESCPLVRFRSYIFHPQISSINGSLNLPERLSKNWTPLESHIWEILLFIYHSFHVIELDNAVNDKAATMYKDSLDRFTKRTRACVVQSNDELIHCSESDDYDVYGDEANPLCYVDYSKEKLHDLKTMMISGEVPVYEDKSNGNLFSWLGETIMGSPLSSMFSF